MYGRRNVNIMRIALPSDNGFIYPRFEDSEEFTLYEVEDEKVIDSWCIYPVGGFCKSVPSAFKEAKINVVLCDGIGLETKLKLRGDHVEMITDVKGSVADAVISYLSGENIGVMDTPPEEVRFNDRIDRGVYRSRRRLKIGRLF